ncbi:MAG TPA: sigma-70 family RNA polymerase sigma factor [Conexibacter sp.]|nr:sigma-70 family RNA polymerase sigma factor [Conexibacter sp.]
MEASALTQSAHSGARAHGRSPLLRLQSDERLIALVRRGNHGAFEVLVGRYQTRLLSFCRHMLGSREDAEDVLQEVFTAAFNAMLADERPINARPWLYRIARNRSLNHLRRVQPIGVDSMDVHLSEHGTTTADKVDKREQFRELIADVQQLPETQRTALLLREIDALSYEQIAEAMETTIPSVKSLLVRARVSLAEAAEARQLSCEDVRVELGEIAEGLRRRTSAPVRRHLRECERCIVFRTELRATSKAIALLLPIGPLLLAKRLLLAHFGLSSIAGFGAGGAGSAASGTAAAGAGASAAAGAATMGGGGLVSAGIGALSTKAAAGIAAAALVTAGAVEIERHAPRVAQPQPQVVAQQAPPVAAAPLAVHTTPHAAAAPAERAEAARKPALPAERETPTSATTTQTTPVPPPETAEPVAAQPGHTHVETGATTLPATLPPTAPPTLVPTPAPEAGTPTETAPPTTTVPPVTTTPAPPPGSTTPEPPPGATTPEPPPAAPPQDGTTPPSTTTPGTTTPSPSDDPAPAFSD